MKRGYWKLDVGDFEMSDADRQHVAHRINEGYIEGELISNEPETEDFNDVVCPYCSYPHEPDSLEVFLPDIPEKVRCHKCKKHFVAELRMADYFHTQTMEQANKEGVEL